MRQMHAFPAAFCAQFVDLGLVSAPSRNGLFASKPGSVDPLFKDGNSIKIVNYGIGKRNRILGHFRRLFWARNYAIVTIVSENSSFSLWIWNSLEKKTTK